MHHRVMIRIPCDHKSRDDLQEDLYSGTSKHSLVTEETSYPGSHAVNYFDFVSFQ